MRVVIIQESARKIGTIMEEEIEVVHIPALVKKSNQMLIFLERGFNLVLLHFSLTEDRPPRRASRLVCGGV
jgi:hypothetical protein